MQPHWGVGLQHEFEEDTIQSKVLINFSLLCPGSAKVPYFSTRYSLPSSLTGFGKLIQITLISLSVSCLQLLIPIY